MDRRFLIIVPVLALLFAFGCGSKDKADVTINTGDGKMSVQSSDGKSTVTAEGANGEKVTMDSKNGEMSMTSTDKDGKKTSATIGGNTNITEADLGVRFYPGSTEKPSEQMKVDSDAEKDIMTCRTTSDDPQKVSDFYKDKVKNFSTTSSTTGDMTMVVCGGELASGAKFSLTAMKKKDAKDTEIRASSSLKKTK